MNEMNDVSIPQRVQNPNVSNVNEPVTAERAWAPFNAEMQNSTDRWMEMARTQAQQTPSAYMQLREVRDREDMDRLNNARRSRELLEASIANTDYGGQMSPRMVEWLNSQRGIVNDGKGVKNGQIMNGGYNPKTGGFGFTVANVDQNGNVTYAPHEMPRTYVYGFMANSPDQFRPDDVERVKTDILHSGPYTEADLGVFANRYKDGRDRLDSEYADAQSRWDYRRGRGGLLGGRGGLTFDQQMALIEQRAKMRAEYGGNGSPGGGSSKFNSDQVQYFINKQQQLMEERSKLDPRKAEDQKRIAEIDEEMLDAKACERIAARQGIIFNGQNIVLPQQSTGAKPVPTGDDVVSKLDGGKTVQGAKRESPFGKVGNDEKNEDKAVSHSPSKTPMHESVTPCGDVKGGDESEYTFSDKKTESDYNEWKKRNERTKFGMINNEFINLPEVKKRKLYEDHGWYIDDSSLFEWLGGRRGPKTKPSFDKKK